MYAYVETAFGRYVGFIAGVLYFLTAILGSSGVVALLADTIGAMAPIFANSSTHFLDRSGRFRIGLAWINVRGVRSGARAVWNCDDREAGARCSSLSVPGYSSLGGQMPWRSTWPGAPALGAGCADHAFRFRRDRSRAHPQRRGERSGSNRPARNLPRTCGHDRALPADPIGRAGNSGRQPSGSFPRRRWRRRRRAFSANPAAASCSPGPAFPLLVLSPAIFSVHHAFSSPSGVIVFSRKLSRMSIHASTPRISRFWSIAQPARSLPLLDFSAPRYSLERRRLAPLFPLLRCRAAANATRCALQWPPVRLSGRLDGAVHRGGD